ncbi:CCR4-NOT transcription complex subunit 3 isoform X1 [Tribolium castaneum]|uniref:CCR4-NOT transcription complex subunit 3 n=2 Tax=Tribolium castaneum TaxID=7070 RepID=D6WH92_TRICA|nr:PREDICTED: CCR4-NOT transcription complex subunit 3 isoform X2 [Tribolium castaneum]EEZ99732.2 CCR4-NOT transcription complex subunit 3-like Protein [Tribolium castaneum]|eukprot:XP_008191430.1 PREDICTED: CCR4-NOT transcription complex subunit 3 isoform X2 [Tribolium castaneum]
MAATRKLQGEIDRCLKKVTEGVETFEDIWQKVHNATNSNQKEKYEADLKKEIKKLQRLRDQIKSWIASAEIKDKSVLMENRKLIETQMERFKVVERETKTKAYSKEGLGAAQKLDPAQKEREEIQHWLVSSIDLLNIQTDTFECEIESLLANKKKKLDKDKQERMDELKSRLERHRFHIRKLETLLRMLDNMSVEVSQIRRIKDNVEYYIECSQEPDFEDNEFIYDDIIGLDEVELSGVGLPSSATTDSNETGGTPTSIISGSSPVTSPALGGQPYTHSSDSSNEADKKTIFKDALKPVKPTAVRATSAMNSSTNSILSYSCNSTTSTPSSKPVLVSSTPSKQSAREASPVAQLNSTGNFATVAATTTASKVTATNGEPVMSSVITNNNQVQTQNNTAVVTSSHTQNSTNAHSTQNSNTVSQKFNEQHVQNSSISPELNNSSRSSPMTNTEVQHIQMMNGPTTESNKIADGMSSLKTMAQQVIDRAGLESNQQQVILEANKIHNQEKSDAHIPPLLGVAPLGTIPLQKEHQAQFQLMEGAYYHMPHPSDSEKVRTYLPRNSYPTPPYYIQTPLPHSDTVEFYQRLANETLFFVFYYMEGTKAQYLAAKALKKQSWRFHTKYMMWFQRHEEPKIINEEYEQGTYIYFDYEKWGQRKKEGFTFEYKYLEDRDLN